MIKKTVFLLAFLALAVGVNALNLTTTCGALNVVNQLYQLQNNVDATGTCFTVTAANVTLDCNGFGINYSASSTGRGVYSNKFNTTVENCSFINQTGTSVSSSGIEFEGATNGTIYNNTITTRGTSSYGIYFDPCNDCNATGNSITGLAASAVSLFQTQRDLFANNFLNGSAYDIEFNSGAGNYISNFTNCTFNKSKVRVEGGSVGSVNFFWYVDVHTVNSTGNDLDSVTINESNVNGTSILNDTTNATGWLARQTIQEYMQNVSGIYNVTPHWFNASKGGYDANNTVQNVTQNVVATIALSQSGTPLTDCGILATPNTTYLLTQSVSTTGTCFNVTAANVTLDCNGYNINFSSTSVGYGVVSTALNTTVQNCFINQTGSTTSSYGIYLNGATYGTFTNNNVTTNGTALWFGGASTNNVFSFNNFSVINATWVVNIGTSSTLNNFTNTSVIGSAQPNGASGLGVATGSNNFWNTTVLTRSTISYGVEVGSDWNNFTDTWVTTNTGTSAYGILVDSGGDNNFFENTYVSTSTATSVGITMHSNNTVFNNTWITTTGAGGNAHGINFDFAYDSVGNYFWGLNVSSASSSGIYLDNSVKSKNFNVYDANIGAVNSFEVASAAVNGNWNFTNSTFNKSSVSIGALALGKLNVFWYVATRVINYTGFGVFPADVNVSNVNYSALANLTTDPAGYTANQTILEYVQNASGVYNATPHWFVGSSAGYATNSSQYSVSDYGVSASGVRYVTIALATLGGGGEINIYGLLPANLSSSNSLTQNLCFSANTTGTFKNAWFAVWSNAGALIFNASNSSAFVNSTEYCREFNFFGFDSYFWSVNATDNVTGNGTGNYSLFLISPLLGVGGGGGVIASPSIEASVAPITALPTAFTLTEGQLIWIAILVFICFSFYVLLKKSDDSKKRRFAYYSK